MSDDVKQLSNAANSNSENENDGTFQNAKKARESKQEALFQQFMVVASHGTQFLMINSDGNPVKSLIQVSTDGEEIKTDFGYFDLNRDTLVIDGAYTKPFQISRDIIPKELCFSLVNNKKEEKSLNFIAKSEKVKKIWMKGFYQLCGSKMFNKFQKEFEKYCQSYVYIFVTI